MASSEIFTKLWLNVSIISSIWNKSKELALIGKNANTLKNISWYLLQ